MIPEQFVAKWRGVTLKERSAAQEHFIDLCRMLGEPTPAEADPTGRWYCFERGAKKAGGGDGWADVWRRACFGWEYKGKGKDLQQAFRQLQIYAPALEYPPLLIVSDITTILIHTAFTGTVPEVHVLTLEDLLDASKRCLLKWAFTEPERLRPGTTTHQITEQAARQFGELAVRMRARGRDPQAVAHFLNRLLFCLFAEDTDLLPRQLFSRLLDAGVTRPGQVPQMLEGLFRAMASGGLIGFETVDRFNGGLFDSPDTLPLEVDDIQLLRGLAALDWSAIEPSIFGTLFERGLDPDKRAQLGAHYTDPGSILRLVNPVVVEPLRGEWAAGKARIAEWMAKAELTRTKAAATKAVNEANRIYQGFLSRLADFRVLDPACGSGNFLYLVLGALKDLEHQVMLEAEALGLQRGFPQVGPEAVRGIEINPYAAELARVTVWIGEIQWMLRHGFNVSRNPILKPLDTIEQRDAVLNPDGTEPDWPAVDVIVGNPPFLGDKKMRGLLGEDYVGHLRRCYRGRVPGGADLVTYWFEKARAQIQAGEARAAGLVATNSIRGGANRKVLERILASPSSPTLPPSGRELEGEYSPSPAGRGVGGEGAGVTGQRIFEAWSDEPWINEGAAVRVSLVAFGANDGTRPIRLGGSAVAEIFSDLTAPLAESSATDLTRAKPAKTNVSVAFIGGMKKGRFELPGERARDWLQLPANPNGRKNVEVLFPWINGLDITRRRSDTWIVDFGVERSLTESALWEAPFQYILAEVEPARSQVRNPLERNRWWLHARPAPDLRKAVSGLARFIGTPRVAKHRLFAWLTPPLVCDGQVVVIARADDTTFGILHSRFHELWSLRLCTWLGKGNDPRYTPTTTFDTFPFPAGLTPADTGGPTETLASGVSLPPVQPERRATALAIAEAAHRLNALRENWLNPPEWVERVPEVVPGYPDRILPKPEHAAALKARTLTNLYNQRPAWLEHAHRALDVAVAAAYGWGDYTPDLPNEEILRRLLALNLERSSGAPPISRIGTR